jgi:hypothetical protein
LNEIQNAELRLAAVHAKYKIQSRVMTVDQLTIGTRVVDEKGARILEEVAHRVLALAHQLECLFDDLLLLVLVLKKK